MASRPSPDPICLVLSSEWPPALLGGLGRYVAEVVPQLASVMPVQLALIPTYLAAEGAWHDQSGNTTRPFDWSEYRECLLRLTVADVAAQLARPAQRVALDCAGVIDSRCSLTLFVQDSFLAPVAQALRDLGLARRIVSVCHLPLHAGFTYFDKPVKHEIHQVLEAQLVRISDLLIAPSRFAADTLSLSHSVASHKIVVVPLGVNRPLPTVPLPKGPLRLAFVGRPIEQKGHQFLFEALSHLVCARRDTRLSIASGTADTVRIRELAARQGVLSQVDFLPNLNHDEMWSFLDTCHALVTTSVYETFGLSVLEAMASARLPIGFAIGSLPELWGPELSQKFGTPLADAQALARKLASLTTDPCHAQCLGELALERARRFTWQAHLQRLLPLLRSDGDRI